MMYSNIGMSYNYPAARSMNTRIGKKPDRNEGVHRKPCVPLDESRVEYNSIATKNLIGKMLRSTHPVEKNGELMMPNASREVTDHGTEYLCSPEHPKRTTKDTGHTTRSNLKYCHRITCLVNSKKLA